MELLKCVQCSEKLKKDTMTPHDIKTNGKLKYATCLNCGKNQGLN